MTEAQTDPTTLQPVAREERVLLLDVLRAVTVLGMCYANWGGRLPPGREQAGVQGAVFTGMDMFVHAKFYPLFALLMGAGMAVQVMRADQRGVSIVPLYLRRLIALYALGWIGSLFLKVDVLSYLAIAALAAFFPCFTLRHHRRLLIGAIVWVGLAAVVPRAMQAYERGPIPTPGTPEQREEWRRMVVDNYEHGRSSSATIRSPLHSFEQVRSTLEDRIERGVPQSLRSPAKLVSDVEYLLFMMTGFFMWQVGLSTWVSTHKRRLTVLLLIAGAVGLASAIGGELWRLPYDFAWSGQPDAMEPYQRAAKLVFGVSAPMGLDLAYIAAITLLLPASGPSRFLKGIAPVGRMAFTSYILQYLLPPILFPVLFGWWLPGIGPIEQVLKVSVMFALMVAFSTWWFRRFRFGPFEWIWRSLTYWKPQPMRVEQPVGTA